MSMVKQMSGVPVQASPLTKGRVLAGLFASLVALLALALGAAAADAAVTYPYTGTSFGPEGVGSGTFRHVNGVAVQESSGDVFVLENSSASGGTLYKFDSAGEPAVFSATGTNAITGVGRAGNGEEELAVDDSSGPDAGDIYVANNRAVRIYSEAGTLLGELTGSEPCGVAVDASGNVYVGDYGRKAVTQYTPTSNPVTDANETASMGGLGGICNIAVDAAGDVYAAQWSGGVTKYSVLQLGSLAASGEAVDPEGKTLAVDQVSGEALIDEQSRIAEYDGATAPPKRLGETGGAGAGSLSSSYGVAIDHANGDIYAGDWTAVEIFSPREVVAGVSTEAATGVTTSEATLNASIEPAGTEVTSCVFEYGTEANNLDQSTPCQPGAPYTGGGTEAVSAKLTGLSFDTTYHYRIAATGTGGSSTGQEESFTTNGPKLSGESASNLTGTSVDLHATVEPENVEITSCEFHYGTQWGTLTESAPCEPATPYTGEAPVAVSAHVSGLGLATTYYYQVVVSAPGGSVSGPEETFTTKGASVSEEYVQKVGATSAEVDAKVNPRGEATSYVVEYGTSAEYGSSAAPVSVGAGEGAVSVSATLGELQPETPYHVRVVATNASGSAAGPDLTFTTHGISATGLPDDRGWELVSSVEDDGTSEAYVPSGTGWTANEEYTVYSRFPVAAAADGNAVSYIAGPTQTGSGRQGQSEGNQFIARRSPNGGWTQTNMQPSGYRSPYFTGFSINLEGAVLDSTEPIGGQGPPAHYEDLYTWSDAGITPFFNMRPPNRSEGAFGSFDPAAEYSERLTEGYAGASADYSHQLFTANDALNGEAIDPSAEMNNLYDSVDGEARSVNVLPNGTPAPNAAFGAPDTYSAATGYNYTGPNYSHVISADGSRVFWTDLNTGSLYVREDGASTRLIAEEATYLTASADGGKVLYTNEAGELYEYDLATEAAEDLEPEAETVGILGASEDLSYVYFVGRGYLASGAEAGKENLYLLHGGETRYVATLGTVQEENAQGVYLETEGQEVTPWAPEIGLRTAEVTPSGRDLTFMSRRSLTGYDNELVGVNYSYDVDEVFVYDAEGGGSLSCVSCDPTGERPAKPPLASAGGFFALAERATYQLHVISEDGGRVFFESAEPLLPHATNGLGLNVYEWERDGSGSCNDSSGCLYLLSTGSSETGSYFIDASASGNDVFLMTRSPLVGEDENEYNDIYDAHVGAVTPPQASLCSGTGCQGVPASPPIFATPASVTYNGVGNFAPGTKTTEPRHKSRSKAQGGEKVCSSGRAAKRKRNSRGKRARKRVCKRQRAGHGRSHRRSRRRRTHKRSDRGRGHEMGTANMTKGSAR